MGCCACGACCCCSLGGCFCWTTYKGVKLALSAVRSIRARPPCAQGAACRDNDGAHISGYSHPEDDDYGFAVRVHGGKGEFGSLRQCFNFMDPYQRGYVNEFAALRELLAHLQAQQNNGNYELKKILRSHSLLKETWTTIDTDGNGYLSFPEVVEFAFAAGSKLGFPKQVGVLGATSSGVADPCTVKGCKCTSFQATPSSASAPAFKGSFSGFWAFSTRKNVSEASMRFCTTPGCGHKRGQHSAATEVQVAAVMPPHWQCVQEAGTGWNWAGWGARAKPADLMKKAMEGYCLMPFCSDDVVAQLQRVVDASVKKTWTRDRGKGPVPSGYRVVAAERAENPKAWLKYVVKAALIKESLEDPRGPANNVPEFEQHALRTSSSAAALSEVGPLDTASNEWLLWHGAAGDRAQGIATGEFKQKYAGTTTGTLYGRGTYLTDSCTKADEYSKEATTGQHAGLYCILLCRVMGGRVKYTTEVEPLAASLEKDVLQGPYDSVLGDREVCRGTFKEVVIYESSQAYPLYLVYYQRIF